MNGSDVVLRRVHKNYGMNQTVWELNSAKKTIALTSLFPEMFFFYKTITSITCNSQTVTTGINLKEFNAVLSCSIIKNIRIHGKTLLTSYSKM